MFLDPCLLLVHEAQSRRYHAFITVHGLDTISVRFANAKNLRLPFRVGGFDAPNTTTTASTGVVGGTAAIFIHRFANAFTAASHEHNKTCSPMPGMCASSTEVASTYFSDSQRRSESFRHGSKRIFHYSL